MITAEWDDPLCWAHQGSRIKERTGSTGNQKNYYWPILWGKAMRFRWAKANNNPTAQFFSIAIAVLRFSQHISKMSIFKSSRISILSARLFWTWPRVYQIYSQIEKLIFLKIEPPRWGCVMCAVWFPDLDIQNKVAWARLCTGGCSVSLGGTIGGGACPFL